MRGRVRPLSFGSGFGYDSSVSKSDPISCPRTGRSNAVKGLLSLAILLAVFFAAGCATMPVTASASRSSAASQGTNAQAPVAATLAPPISAPAPSSAPIQGASAAAPEGASPARPKVDNGQPRGAAQAEPAASSAPQRDSRLWPQGYYPGDPLPPRTVYLTFDDGPSDFTLQILDILKEEGVHATFFLNSYDKDNPFHADTGKNFLFRYAAALRRMVDEGHAVGNHTYSHQDLADLSLAQIVFQLNTLQRQLAEVLGDKMPRIHLIRPPFGSPWYSASSTDGARKRVGAILSDRGLVMLWTVGWDSSDSFDWAKGEWYTTSSVRYSPGTASYDGKMDRETARLLKSADGTSSGIVLMHDTHPTTRDILKSLIEDLKQRGYSFGTLEDYCRWRWGPEVFSRFDSR